MLLGKRPRPPMRRTTSMTEFAGDFVPDADATVGQSADQITQQKNQRSHPRERQRVPEVAQRRAAAVGGGDWLEGRYMGLMVSPRSGGHRRNSGDLAVVETAPFLRNCGLCKRRLGPGRDTFMYRGEIAFCSLECRQQQMSLDEKEKCSISSMKDTASSGSESGSDGTIAAA